MKTALNDEKQGLLRRHISTMVNTILRRKQFKISDKEMFTNLVFRCCPGRFKCGGNRQTYKLHRLIEKADHAVTRKLDILDLLKAKQLN